jgi:hypothetical protein
MGRSSAPVVVDLIGRTAKRLLKLWSMSLRKLMEWIALCKATSTQFS